SKAHPGKRRKTNEKEQFEERFHGRRHGSATDSDVSRCGLGSERGRRRPTVPRRGRGLRTWRSKSSAPPRHPSRARCFGEYTASIWRATSRTNVRTTVTSSTLQLARERSLALNHLRNSRQKQFLRE